MVWYRTTTNEIAPIQISMERESYINATEEAGKAFYLRQIEGPVVMLNLLKFREVADYSGAPHLAPDTEISGKQAYKRYIEHTLPFLKAAGSEVLFQGKGGAFLIGPEEEDWDTVLLVKHTNAAKFLQFASSEEYLKGAGHRTAALADSRLLPIETKDF